MSGTVTHHTFTLKRIYPKSADKVFAAFSDPAKLRKWFADGDHHTVENFQHDFRVGGQDITRSRFNHDSPFPGVALINESTYLDIVPGKRIVTASTMTVGEHRISASLVTFEIQAEGNSTKLLFTHQGAFFEGSDGPEIRQHGWNVLLDKLGNAM